MKTVIVFLSLILTTSIIFCQSIIVYDSGTSVEVGSGADISADVITVNGTFTGSGTFNHGPLPVELISFTANEENGKVVLNWKTVTEVNNYGFEIERSQTAIAKSEMWGKIGFVQGHGNSNSPKEYSFIDNNTQCGKTKYRLKQIDFIGAFEYSNEIEILIDIPQKYVLHQNYPNPFNPNTIINYELPIESKVTIKIFDVLGREVGSLIDGIQNAGNYKLEFDGRNVSSGIYFYKINAGNFFSTRKMLLTK